FFNEPKSQSLDSSDSLQSAKPCIVAQFLALAERIFKLSSTTCEVHLAQRSLALYTEFNPHTPLSITSIRLFAQPSQ
ncbi:hypothetical protein V8Z74_17075, partial [Comamonas sp. w2-DMI]|uniref:hypothetical protein n=1 Tax=Comamonas sp. w2-DMI TaxID=3126391 RepID=UPI0032E482B3